MTSREQQLFLFSQSEERTFKPDGVGATLNLEMDRDRLLEWKTQIAAFQQTVRVEQPDEQGSLFQLDQQTVNPTAVDPFYLTLYNFFFFEWPADRHPGKPCIYFVIDTHVPLILYIGETCKANKRWKGIHDCKRYVLNYQSLHYRHQLKTTINTAFYWNTPSEVRPRQRLESGLIYRWRSPFNKENWDFWNTPFIGEK